MSSAVPFEPDDRDRASGVTDAPALARDTSSGLAPRAPSSPRMPGNALGRETSPYLRRHAGQKIRWQAWNQQSFALAERSGRPILVSIGYLACYWCHVMAEESFSDPRVIRVVNRDFVAIKVDREERPDVDRAVLDAHGASGRQDRVADHGLPDAAGRCLRGRQLLSTRAAPWTAGLARRDGRRGAALSGWHGARTPPEPSRAGTAQVPSAVTDIESYAVFLANRLLDNVDTLYGGFGQTGPRFPQVSAHQLLWRHFVVSGNRAFGDAVVASLSRICGSALADAVGGGFHRYCVDDAWTIPHFEKMLYDNAQLVELLTWVWRGARAEPDQGRDRGVGRLVAARDADPRRRLRVEPRRPCRPGYRRDRERRPVLSLAARRTRAAPRCRRRLLLHVLRSLALRRPSGRDRCNGRSGPSATRTGAA